MKRTLVFGLMIAVLCICAACSRATKEVRMMRSETLSESTESNYKQDAIQLTSENSSSLLNSDNEKFPYSNREKNEITTEDSSTTIHSTTHPQDCVHDWAEATCDRPKTCIKCGLTQGDPNEHFFAAATCIMPKTCRNCGVTSGSALGHDYDAYGVCVRCGQRDPNATTTPGEGRTPEEFYALLCTDTWVEIQADLTNSTTFQFEPNGYLNVAWDGQVYETRLTNPKFSLSEIKYTDGDTEYYFEDIGSDDIIHYQSESVCSYHCVLIRESKLNQNEAMANRLSGTQWKSPWFSKNGINPIKLSDFDIVPVNDKIAFLTYHNKVGYDHVHATVVASPGSGILDVYLTTTYDDVASAPETSLYVERWTQVF